MTSASCALTDSEVPLVFVFATIGFHNLQLRISIDQIEMVLSTYDYNPR